MGSVLFAVCALLAYPGKVTATGPYTLPYWDHSTTISRGYSASHKGIDYVLSYPGEPVVASRQGVVATEYDGYPDSGLCNSATYSGNWVLISHGGSRWTLYLHLKQNQNLVGANSAVSAGQQIATSGNSGRSCGWHLHYSLHNTSNWLSDAGAINPGGQWTTADPGRVPFLAAYVREHSPSGYNVMQYSQWTTWVEFRNDGGRTWDWTNDSYGRSRIFLAATYAAGCCTRPSTFYVSGDWEQNWLPGKADTDDVAPGQVARYTFQLRAASGGLYYERFNLVANSIYWFNYPYMGNFYIPITVQHCC